MNYKMLKGYSFLLYFLSLIVSFFIGITYAGIIDAGKNQGLAGGAIVLGYAFMAMVIGFVISLFVAHKVDGKIIFKINIILSVLMVCFFVYYYLRYTERQNEKTKENQEIEQPHSPTKPISSLKEPSAFLSLTKQNRRHQNDNQNMGLGMFSPHLHNQKALYFYNKPNLKKNVLEHQAIDSITFKKLEHGGFDIMTAPPWLAPHHLKLDYDILYFKIHSITQEFIEITVNTITNQTSFLNKNDGKIMYWPEFLLRVNSVEFLNPEAQTIHIKPFINSGKVKAKYSFMKPLQIKNNWMYVKLIDDNFKAITMGWIEWHKEGSLLISYSLLS